MFIANIVCKFKGVKKSNSVEGRKNVNQRCWYAAYNLASCKTMLDEANEKLAELKTLERPDNDFRIACWEHTIQVLTDEIAYRERNGID